MAPLNPANFAYGSINNDYVALSATPDQTYFASSYAKTNYREDRAELFADLMFRAYKNKYHTAASPINQKFKLIASQIDQYYNTVGNAQEHWERLISY